MATGYYKCHGCGELIKVRTAKNRKETDRYCAWLESQERLCDDCQKIEFEKQNAAAAAKAKEDELPELTGTPKQVAWAETIRQQMAEVLSTWFDRHQSHSKYNDYMAISDQVLAEPSAHWWIENRLFANIAYVDKLLEKYVVKTSTQEQPEANPAAQDARAEATIYPAGTSTGTPAEIRHEEGRITIHYPIKDEAFWKIVKVKLGFEWSGSHWQKTLSVTDEAPQDRLSEAGNLILAAGIPIILWDEDIRHHAINGDYTPLQTRWITHDTKAKQFRIQWNRGEDFYSQAKRIPTAKWIKATNSIQVNPDEYGEILDFAAMHDFKLSPGALALVEQMQQSRHKSLIAEVSTPVKTPAPITKPVEYCLDAEALDD